MILTAREIVSGGNVFSPGWIEIDGDQIAAVGAGDPRGTADHRFEDHALIPGFTDIHVHGALGHDFTLASAQQAREAVDFHARTGTTSIVASIATTDSAQLQRAVIELAPLVHAGVIAGIHLEGPYLSPARRGAHDPALLRAPDAASLRELVAVSDGAIRMFTLAPELPGADEAIAALREAGVTIALGHSDASASVAENAVDLGARVVTHAFNGMRPLHHRDPGLVGVALTDQRLQVEVIVDGQHLADRIVDLVRAGAPDRYMVVSDAMAATGLADGEYVVAGSAVQVRQGVARTVETGSLAGSTSVLADAARRLQTVHGASSAEIASATSLVPRRAVGLPEASLRQGDPADLVVLPDGGSDPIRVLRSGRWLE